TTDLVFKNRGDTSYDLEFTNIEGTEYSFPLITNRGGTYKFGDNTKDTHLIEGFNITRNDYFVVSDDTDDTAVTKVLKYDSIDTASKKVTFTDLGDSSKPTGTYTTAVADGGSSAATVNIGGTTYNFNIFRQGSTYNLKFDLNGGGSVGTDDRPVIVTKGGGILYLMGTANQTQLGGSSLNVTQANNTNNLGFAQGNVSGNVGFGFRTMSKNIDDSTVGDLYVNWTVTNRTNNEVGLNTPNGTNMSALINHDGNDELNSAQDRYGTLIVYTNPSSSDQSEKIEITYPTQQLEAQVFAVGESYTTTTTEVGNAFVVNEIAVGAAVLDVDAPAVGSKPLIVVGGPSINTVAAELMGNPTQEEVLELFSAGKAVIKLYETDNALLVAGYEALETQGAARVLANYDEYELTGSEVEVVVPSLTDLSVTAVSSE
ncbi:hypothetical protein CMO92_02210, partial [Candidatus Woesearchaeota archaeon]|nr:hypothetical protein [Candidatus Woesearchaeota archaeon]